MAIPSGRKIFSFSQSSYLSSPLTRIETPFLRSPILLSSSLLRSILICCEPVPSVMKIDALTFSPFFIEALSIWKISPQIIVFPLSGTKPLMFTGNPLILYPQIWLADWSEKGKLSSSIGLASIIGSGFASTLS